MPTQLSTAIEGSGIVVDTVAVGTSSGHRQIVALGNLGDTGANSTAVTIGAVALLAGSSGNLLGSIASASSFGYGVLLSTAANSSYYDGRTRSWTLSSGENVGVVPAGSSTYSVGQVYAGSTWPTSILSAGSSINIGVVPAGSSSYQLGTVYLGSGSSGNVLGAVYVGSGTTGNTVGSAALLAGSTGNDIGTVAIASSSGNLLAVRIGQVRNQVVSTGATLSSTAETQIVAAGGATIYRDISHLTMTNESTATPVEVIVRSSSASGTTYSFFLAERGGLDANYSPPWPQATANSAWTATVQTAGITVDVNVIAISQTS